MADLQVQPAAEFQALPLEFIISAPLTGVIKAQAIAAATTKAFIEGMLTKDDSSGNNVPVTVDFSLGTKKTNGSTTTEELITVKAPLLAIVPVPHIRIDSMTVNFKYEISQIVKENNAKEYSAGLDVGTTGILSKFISGTLKGNISSKSAEDSVMNRSGMLEITVHASEAPMPEGLAKMLSLLSKSIPSTEQV